MATIPEALALAQQYHRSAQLPQAAEVCRRVLQVDPANTNALWLLGLVLQSLSRYEEAAVNYRLALQINPLLAEVHNNLGNALQDLGKLTEAEASIREALRLKPEYANAHHNLGNVLRQMGKLDEATAHCQQAIRFQPHHADAHKNLGVCCLLKGNLEQGWPEYEWRWRCPELTPRPFPQPIWDGTPLAGRAILLHAEQGLGDTLQFIRYAALVKERGGITIVECPPPLAKLVSRCRGIDRLVIGGEPLPAFEVHAPLLSLPGILKTSLATVPADVPYLFVDGQLVAHWQRELAGVGEFKIGIAWQGSALHPGDRFRSFPLTHFAALAQLHGVRLVSLQKGHGREQLLSTAATWGVIDVGGKTSDDIQETAAVIKNLDLVISADTAVAHLAGGLGVPVWVALPFAPDWRWMLERDDSPWYPSMRLFRQTEVGHWGPVFERIRAALAQLVMRSRRDGPNAGTESHSRSTNS